MYSISNILSFYNESACEGKARLREFLDVLGDLATASETPLDPL